MFYIIDEAAVLLDRSQIKEAKMIELNAYTYPIRLPETLSEKVNETLERSLADYLEYKEVILVNTLESAFSLALSPLQHKSGLLCSPNAPIAFFNAVASHDFQPEYCDLQLDGTMESRFFLKSKTSRTKALVLSHNHGLLSECQKAVYFAQEQQLMLIEDATQAFGKREKSGADIAIFSLDALLPSSITDGAFIATDNVSLASSLRQKAKGGYVQKKFWNYELVSTDPDLALAPFSAQLALSAFNELDQRAQRCQEIRNGYMQRLASNRLLELPNPSALVTDALFPIALVPALFCPKEEIYEALITAGVPVKVGNKPVYKTAAFMDDTLSLFGAEEVYKAQLLLPSHYLLTPDELTYVIETLERILKSYGYRGCSF